MTGGSVAALAKQLAQALASQQPGKGKTFLHLAVRWLRTEGRQFVCPENERRHLRHMRALWALREGDPKSKETLSPKQIRKHLRALLRSSGGNLSPATVNKLRSTGRRIIRAAQEEGDWHSLNPFEVVRRVREHKPEHRIVTLKELRSARPFLKDSWYREAVVMITLGPRPGELKAVRKEDVDKLRRTVVWRRSNARNSTKTGKVRTVPIPKSVWPVFVEALNASACDLVFPGPDGRRQRPDTKRSRTLRIALAKAGLVSTYRYICNRKGCHFLEDVQAKEHRRCPRCETKLRRIAKGINVTWYGLRHSCASLLEEAGCDQLVIQRILGHSEKSTADRHYKHLSLEFMRRELSKLRL
jgi:integrase